MKRDNSMQEPESVDRIISVCFGAPRGDELPQVAGEADILADIYSDVLNVSRGYAAGRLRHQFDDDYGIDDMIH